MSNRFLGSKSYWFLFATLALAALFGGGRWKLGALPAPTFVKAPQSQARAARLFHEVDGSQLIHADPDVGLALDALAIGPRGALFTLYEGKHRVLVEWNAEGARVRDIDVSRSQGVESVSGMAVGTNNVVLADVVGGKLHWFTLDGASRANAALSEPYRVTSSHISNQVAVLTIGLPTMLTARMLTESPQPDSVGDGYGVLFQEQKTYSLAADGWIANLGPRVYFSGKYATVLGAFSGGNDDPDFLVETIGEQSLPVVVQNERGLWLEPSSPEVSAGIAGAGKSVYVLASGTGGQFVDAYRAEDGEYCFSHKLRAGSKWRGIGANEDHLYLLAADGVWALPRRECG